MNVSRSKSTARWGARLVCATMFVSSPNVAFAASPERSEQPADEGEPETEPETEATRPRPPAPGASEIEAPLGGGYWGPLGKAPPAPPDGAWQRTTGSIMLPLGILRAGAGALSIYASKTPRCEAWLDGNETTCNGLRAYGYWGLAFGAAMAITGATFLALGVARGRRYAEWKRQWAVRVLVLPGTANLRIRWLF